MDETIKEQQIKDLKVKVVYDEISENPRDWDNIGKMVCFRTRYNLGDETDLRTDQFEGWNELKAYLVKEKKAFLILPLRLYDHSGISISVSSSYPFNCPWDSMQVGFIYCTKEDIKENYLVKNNYVKRITKKILNKAEEELKQEVKTYNQYLNGEVFGFVVEDSEEKHIDSCYGFYDVEEALKEGIESAEWTIKNKAERERKNTLLPYIQGG